LHEKGGASDYGFESSRSLKPGAAASSNLLANARSGATILGAQSSQTFHTVSDITNEDTDLITTITVRLIVGAGRAEYMSLSRLRPIMSTSVPPPIDV